jgi:hypothetical protein
MSMITSHAIWRLLRTHAPRKRWVSSKELYALVEMHAPLNDEDRKPFIPGMRTPKWKYLVREVLLSRTRRGVIQTRHRHAGLSS